MTKSKAFKYGGIVPGRKDQVVRIGINDNCSYPQYLTRKQQKKLFKNMENYFKVESKGLDVFK